MIIQSAPEFIGKETEDGEVEVPSYGHAAGEWQSLAPAQVFWFITL